MPGEQLVERSSEERRSVFAVALLTASPGDLERAGVVLVRLESVLSSVTLLIICSKPFGLLANSLTLEPETPNPRT